MNADSPNSSYWPKMEDELDGPMILAKILRAADRNPRMDRDDLASLLWEKYQGDLIEVIRHCSVTEDSRAAEALKAALGWITRDFKVVKRGMKFSEAQAAELLGMEVVDPCRRDAMARCMVIAMRLGAIGLIFTPDVLDGLSMTDYARRIGVSKQRLDIQIREANEHFGSKGRFQKSETASLSYAEAQMGNNNRVKNRANHAQEEFLSQS